MEQLIEYGKKIIISNGELRDFLDKLDEFYSKDWSEWIGTETWAGSYWGALCWGAGVGALSAVERDNLDRELKALTKEQKIEAIRVIIQTRCEWVP